MKIGRILISYRSEDAEKVARSVAQHLENEGVEILRYDTRFAEAESELRKALDVAAVRGSLVLLFVNPPYHSEPNVFWETAFAQRGEFPLFFPPASLSGWEKELVTFLQRSRGHEPQEQLSSAFRIFHFPPSMSLGTAVGRQQPDEEKPALHLDLVVFNTGAEQQVASNVKLALSKTATTEFKIEFDESMSDKDAEQFLAFFRQAAKEVTGKEPRIAELVGDE